MDNARESQNIVTQAMQELAGMRGVNHALRTLPAQVEAPPLSDDDIIEQFRRDTGHIINSNGEVIGHDPNWRSPEGAHVDNVAKPAPVPPPQEGQDVFGFGRKKHPLAEGSRVVLSKIKGIDLEAGDVIIDNMRYPLSAADIKQVARFCLGAMQTSLLNQIKELAQDYDVIDQKATEENTDAPKGDASSVQPVPDGEASGDVLPQE